MKFWMSCTFSLSFSLLLAGCSSTPTLFTAYPNKMATNLHDLKQGDYPPAIQALTGEQTNHDYELYAAELGRVQQLAGDTTQSSATFLPLMQKVESDQLQAKIRGSAILADSASLMTNDNAIPYQLNGFEIVLLYQFQALNFIADHDLTHALVTLRKANIAQNTLSTEYQSEIAAADAKIKTNQLNPDFTTGLQKQMADTLTASAEVKSSFLNAMTYYLFALSSEANGNLNDAVVALKQAISITPSNTYLQSALLEALQAQGADPSIINNYLKAFNLKAPPQISAQSGHLVIWYDQHFIPPLKSFNVSLYLPALNQSASFAFPIYKKVSTAPIALQISLQAPGTAPAENLPSTEVITNVYGLAAKQLQEEYPLIFLRQALRVTLQAGVVASNQNSSQSNQLFADLTAAAMNFMSSFADLRSWLSLPDNTQIGSYALAPQTYTVQLKENNKKISLQVPIQTGQTTLIWVTQYGTQFNAKILNLDQTSS
ncbi:MAG: hypothetical protein NTV32_04530 [Gammaproteobacteria bacterium]|nr:hypothetical protein [Gammaproteobacteria bacterium]